MHRNYILLFIILVIFPSQILAQQEYDDVFFNSSFESGNLYNVTFVSGDEYGNRNYQANINYSTLISSEYHWWFFVKLENASGKMINLNLTNVAQRDIVNNRWPNIIPRYSYDFCEGNINPNMSCYEIGNWDSVNRSFIDYGYNNITNTSYYSFSITPINNSVWVASNIPYTITRRDRCFDNIEDNQYVSISVIDVSPNGIPITAATITDFTFDNSNKTKIYIIGQQHANEETQGSWAIEGAINYLLNETAPNSDILKEKYIFKFIPIVNVDGVYSGTGRFTPVYLNGTNYLQYDLNREWQKARLNNISNPAYSVIRSIYPDIGNFNPNASFDFHGSANGESGVGIPSGINYYLIDGNLDEIMSNLLSNITAYWEYVHPDYTRQTNYYAMPPNVRQGFGIHPSVTVEWSVTNVSITEIPDQNDWLRHGKSMLLGIDSYYNSSFVNHPPIIQPISNITINETELAVILINATDPDGDPLLYAVNDSRLIHNNESDPVFYWYTTFNDAGVYLFKLSASDGNLTVFQDIKIIVNNVNRAPIIQPISDINVNERENVVIIVNASDPDADLLIYSINDSRFLQNNNIFLWQTQAGDSGNHTFTTVVSDSQINVSTTVNVNVNRRTYSYIPGDVNGDNQTIGSDVTFLVRYFKGIGSPPVFSVQTENGTFYPAADANGDCKNLGSDVTYLVAYFKGAQPSIRYCPTYPPVNLK